MKLVSWNVNGLRAAMQKGFKDFSDFIMISRQSAITSVVGDDFEKLKNVISQLQNEGKKKDGIIQKLKEDKMKMEKRIQELEKMLSTFMEMEK